MYKYKCGHSEIRPKLILRDTTFSNLQNTKEAYEFQKDGIKFVADTNFRCLIADSMGLGKTIQALISVRNARLLPCIVLVRSSTIYQWAREIQDWVQNDLLAVLPISGTQSPVLPGFSFYVISMDTFSRKDVWKQLTELHPKAIIIDECHSFKDAEAKRTKALVRFVNTTNTSRIFLSGTPIKNRANEFFVTLNLIAPERFPSYIRFQREWLEQDERGVYSRLKHWKIDEFHRTLSHFMIRREKEQVLPNLPPITRDYQFVSTDDEAIKSIYNTELDLFDNFIRNGDKINAINILEWLTRLRKITAIAKIPLASEWIQEFQAENGDKLAVGIHHHAVRDTLRLKFPSALTLSGEDSALQKDEIVQKFAEHKNRLLVINIGSGGLGLNLQFCWNALILERYWNSTDEEQFEGRFYRDGQKHPVSVTYMMLQGSIDEWFHELVAQKREIFGETLGSWQLTRDPDGLRQLAEKTIQNRL
jgi:SWI/SNF-related matrix-associated actin-dependent regulator 1 of chromatin subfamily A